MDWTELLKIPGGLAGSLGAGIASYIFIKRPAPIFRKRAKLKTDLEIFHMLRPEIQGYEVVEQVKSYIETMIYDIYALHREVNWWRLIPAVICFLVFSFWTLYLVADGGFSWWAIATGYFAFVSVGLIITATKKKRVVQPPPKADIEK
ncbi:MAG: hypothetical protein KAV87_06540 [Desulfobacteraceae bacterium]|nr:hypothetical protein [Desulfobacteraceae bacterium]